MSFYTSGPAGGASRRVDWNTPPEIVAKVRELGPIYLDPCSNANSVVGAKVAAVEDDDGLRLSWRAPPGEVVFVNPPYGRGKVRPFAEKFAEDAHARASHLIALVPARVETKWFATFADSASAWCAVRGRLRFLVDGKLADPAPFPSAILYAGPEPRRFAEVFGELGAIWTRLDP
jgi:phage N-6-adenine-methyltransferase